MPVVTTSTADGVDGFQDNEPLELSREAAHKAAILSEDEDADSRDHEESDPGDYCDGASNSFDDDAPYSDSCLASGSTDGYFKPDEDPSVLENSASDIEKGAYDQENGPSSSGLDAAERDASREDTPRLPSQSLWATIPRQALLAVKAAPAVQYGPEAKIDHTPILRSRLFVPLLFFTLPSYRVWIWNLNIDACVFFVLGSSVADLKTVSCPRTVRQPDRPPPRDFIQEMCTFDGLFLRFEGCDNYDSVLTSYDTALDDGAHDSTNRDTPHSSAFTESRAITDAGVIEVKSRKVLKPSIKRLAGEDGQRLLTSPSSPLTVQTPSPSVASQDPVERNAKKSRFNSMKLEVSSPEVACCDDKLSQASNSLFSSDQG